MGTVEHHACREQSRTERNTGIDGGGQNPAASRRSFGDNHRNGALTAKADGVQPRAIGRPPPSLPDQWLLEIVRIKRLITRAKELPALRQANVPGRLDKISRAQRSFAVGAVMAEPLEKIGASMLIECFGNLVFKSLLCDLGPVFQKRSRRLHSMRQTKQN
jgi:hypothetical protein